MGFQVTEVQKSLKGFDYPGSPDELARMRKTTARAATW
jgi:hypothetical protein